MKVTFARHDVAADVNWEKTFETWTTIATPIGCTPSPQERPKSPGHDERFTIDKTPDFVTRVHLLLSRSENYSNAFIVSAQRFLYRFRFSPPAAWKLVTPKVSKR
ncbi:hypothetical protein Rcae01_06437 [Novipirellula caenicola]|uniref:Uncharacterized protein n=1 Tax=Novipirellula caenicola TaxID=1536901 RepID=A0ABP9W2B3_9BACT